MDKKRAMFLALSEVTRHIALARTCTEGALIDGHLEVAEALIRILGGVTALSCDD